MPHGGPQLLHEWTSAVSTNMSKSDGIILMYFICIQIYQGHLKIYKFLNKNVP